MAFLKYIIEKLVLIGLFKNWYAIPISILGIDSLLGQERKLTMRNGYKIYFDDFHSLWPFKEIFVDNGYKFHLKENKLVIFDVGANVGAFTLYAKSVCPDCRIYAFEPSKSNFKLLSKNIKINKISKDVILLNFAVGSKRGTSTMNETSQSTMRTITHTSINEPSLASVEVTTIPAVVRENRIYKIDFMKIDIEGGEYEALFSVPTSIYKKIKIISLEYHNIDKERNGLVLAKFLESKGFIVRKRTENDKVGLIYAVRH